MVADMKMTPFRFALLVAAVAVVLTGCGDSEGEPPRLSVDADAEVTYTAGLDRVSITVTASDPRDQQLELELARGPSAADFETHDDMGIFSWTPNVGDITDGDPHEIVFAATNEDGASAEETVRIHVEGEGGTAFVSSSNQLYDPSSGEPLVFDVEVQHDDAADVELTMPAEHAPQGAQFEQVDDYLGQFEWTPTSGQREQRSHSVLFRADDGAEDVEQEVTIIIQSFDSGGTPTDADPDEPVCDEDDAFFHNPVEVGTGADDYQITGQVQDTSRDWEEAVLYWTYGDPMETQEEYFSTSMELDGTAFSGTIDNPLVESGQALDISYVICVYDGTGDEEGVVCAPRDYYYRFVAYPPGEDGGGCRDDGLDMSEPATAGEISSVAWEEYRVCQDEPNYHEFEVDAAESAEIILSYGVEREPDIDVEVDGASVDIEQFPCIGLAYVEIDEPGTVQVRVAADHFAYHVTAFVDGDQECPLDHQTPDEAIAIDEEFVFHEDQLLCSDDDIDVYAFDAMVGDFMDALLDFDPGQGTLEMTLYGPDDHDGVTAGGPGLQGAAAGDDGAAYLSHQADQSGIHYLSVHAEPEPTVYDLATSLQCSGDDEFEGNDTLGEARQVEFGTWDELRLCGGDSDWYGYLHDGVDASWVEVRAHLREGGDQGVELTVFDEDGDEIDGVDDQGSDTADTRESIVELEPDELVLFEVQADSPLVYDLEVDESGFQ